MSRDIRKIVSGSDSRVQGLLGVTTVHEEVEAFGELGADPASGGRDALASTDQQVRQQGGPLAARLASAVSLPVKTQQVSAACLSSTGKADLARRTCVTSTWSSSKRKKQSQTFFSNLQIEDKVFNKIKFL